MAIYPGDEQLGMVVAGRAMAIRVEIWIRRHRYGCRCPMPPSLGEPGEAVGMWRQDCAYASSTVVWPLLGLGLGAFVFVRRRPPTV